MIEARQMTRNPTRPGKPSTPAPKSVAPKRPAAVGNALRQAQTRWQRTTRYGWDKGGSGGGR
ncbi:MAG: hypothetical protein IPK44_09490 [Candidatus Accumulibacter sp.]|uniref:hypothetical protein n=1 Tax=Accumulibacter sp. TaxID=2053492 RepID=UPI0025827B67|nr:hypothetical protein [Accumulibacter sp.]MBK8114734.1 hypothetical protein [Accumulibacter sp.]